MIIDVEFDSSTTGAPAGFFTAVNAAVEYWERELINPLTVTIVFGYNKVDGQVIGSSALAQSESNGITVTYANLKTALSGAATSANDMTSVAHLPSADPSAGAGFFVTLAESEALGLFSTANTTVGYAGISSAFPFTFDPNNRAVAGDYDAIGAMEHEVSEVLGRIAGSGTVVNNVAQFSPLDLFRYVSAGNLAVTPEAAFFSIDGTHLLLPFNDPTTGNDAGDWDPSVNGDSFGFGSQGVAGIVSPTDLELMDVLGYKMAADPTAKNDFNADGRSQFLIRNSAGTVAVGEFANGHISYDFPGSPTSGWTFKGDGDFLGAGSDQYLIQNSAGAVDVAEVIGGHTVFTQIAAFTGWSFVGVGDYLGLADGDQYLIRNSTGGLLVANSESGHSVYTPVGGLGSQWTIEGSGNFLGDGKSDLVIENTSGAVDIGEVNSKDTLVWAQVASLPSGWKFVGATGDFLADGKDQFLIENAAGAVDVAEVVNGHAVYTQVATLAAQWKFVGSGDYLADGHDQFLIENASGAVDVGDWFSNQIHYTQLATLASVWSFH